MASHTLKNDRFAVGASVGVYLRSQKSANVGAAPVGSAISSATVAADGTLTFLNLLDNTDYTAYLSGVYVDFRTGPERTPRFGQPQPVVDAERRFWAGNGSVAETIPRRDAAGNVTAPATGTLLLCGGAILPAGQTVTRVGFVSGTTAAGTPTNQWFSIVDARTRAVLAVTANDLTTAWAANTLKELILSARLTPTEDTPIYFGLLVTATTVPTLAGTVLQTANVAALAPVLVGTSNTGLTTPQTVGTIDTAPTATAGLPYAYAR